ncbi:EamA family transporter [Marinitenerispora sediminis]|uniref:EamA family transporter n=1 Tax=Marinitenerispora sediminis TaxID=1931232 RepID=A0A368T7N8_9ACTN|nr:EamA family transporter [Marinitenerispora sediminis]RCV51078.1 EamA family transporter [Marinitenerispora sediminis]RCV56575.1 EamA family transporter [Marinitenerispora sediminis]RCV60073.1 EamA family transporter [Marinitenerispora sediminis]
MSPLAVLAVLCAAALHASWNAIAHAVTDRLAGFTVLVGTAAVCGALLVPFTGLPDPAAWPYLVASAALHVLYHLALMASYRTGDFGQVYPLARGTSPWVVALVAVLLLGEEMSGSSLFAVLVISAGLTALVFAGGRPGRAQAPALLAALATGLLIAAYTVVDGLGVRVWDDPVGYIAWLMLLQGPPFAAVAVLARRRALPGALRPVWRVGVVGGVLATLSYGLVLWAQTFGVLAGVAALRESSIVFGAVIGTVLFGERFGRVRVVSAVAVALGILLLYVDP